MKTTLSSPKDACRVPPGSPVLLPSPLCLGTYVHTHETSCYPKCLLAKSAGTGAWLQQARLVTEFLSTSYVQLEEHGLVSWHFHPTTLLKAAGGTLKGTGMPHPADKRGGFHNQVTPCSQNLHSPHGSSPRHITNCFDLQRNLAPRTLLMPTAARRSKSSTLTHEPEHTSAASAPVLLGASPPRGSFPNECPILPLTMVL